MTITIDKALEIIKKWGEEIEDVEERDFSEAVQLGVEALKRMQDCRQAMCGFAPTLLPSETKE